MEIIDIGVDNATAFRVNGKITKHEMQIVFEDMRLKIKQFGKVGIYEEIQRIGGVEFGAIAEELRYLKEIGFKNIVKVAVVSDKNWLAKVVELENKLFRNIDIQCFSSDEKQRAIDFLKSD